MFTFTVLPDSGEEYQVTADSRDVCAWERKSSKNSLANLQHPRMADLYGLAYTAATREGRFRGEQGVFEQTHRLEMEDDAAPDPTQSDRSAEQ